MYHRDYVYMFRKDKDYFSLLDGRHIRYVAKNIPLNREATSKILRSLKKCTYEQAKRIIDVCKYNGDVLDYFEKI